MDLVQIKIYLVDFPKVSLANFLFDCKVLIFDDNTKVWILKEVRSEKKQLWIVEHFHLHKKVPVVMNQNIQFFQTLWFISTGTFLWRWKCSTILSCIFPKWLLTKTILYVSIMHNLQFFQSKVNQIWNCDKYYKPCS